jgi:hypothetical protein
VVDESKKAAMKLREVLECGSPLPLFTAWLATRKRQRAVGLQNAGAPFVSATELLP